jgi:hypothetical protein
LEFVRKTSTKGKSMSSRRIKLVASIFVLICAGVTPRAAKGGGIFRIVSTICYAGYTTTYGKTCAINAPLFGCTATWTVTESATSGSCDVQTCVPSVGGGLIYCGPPNQNSNCTYSETLALCNVFNCGFGYTTYSRSEGNGCVSVTAY